MKQKLTSLDIAAIVFELQNLVGLRLQQLYDVSSRVFQFKFTRPDHKQILVVEAGIRLHLTQFDREKEGQPGAFCMKLRKYIKNKRLTSIRQLGIDRIVDLEFGQDQACQHLLLEFYAGGNLILTDSDYKIITLWRSVGEEADAKFQVGEYYPFQVARSFEPLTRDRILECLQKSAPKDQLKKVLSMRLDYSVPMIEHLLNSAGFQANAKMSTLKQPDGSFQNELVDKIFQALIPGDQIVTGIATKQSKGYIVTKSFDDSSPPIYDDFQPFLLDQAQTNVKEFETFNAAVDEYFSSIETQKVEMKTKANENMAVKKLESARKEHESRIEGLELAQHEYVHKAQLVEQNLEIVDQAITIIRSALSTGMDWTSLAQLVEEEKIKRNPIALIIDSFKLETNQVTLLLKELDFDSEDGEVNVEKTYRVDVDIGLSAHSNARKYYETKKVTAKKQEKTVEASGKALKSIEQKVLKEMKQVKISATITRMRKSYWFEKFEWFISSENYIVVAGRDAQQNEMLVKKYLRKGDVYIHADIPGSSSIIIKNHSPEYPIPANTLNEAGTMAIVYSRAWDAKVVTSAYWVYHDQVSKTAPTGEYLSTGSFMIRGKKNYLPPSQLVYGYGLLFKVDDECIQNHLHERRPGLRAAENEDSAPSSADTSRPASSIIQAEKYSLEEYGKDEDFDDDSNDIIMAVSKKKSQQKQPAEKKDPSPEPKPTESASTDVAKKSSALPRGKRTKVKRAKEKYRNQDEEDRQIRMQLLASSGKQQEVSESDQSSEESSAEEKASASLPISLLEMAKSEKMQDIPDEDVDDKIQESNHEDSQESIVEKPEEETEALTNIDSLTGCPVESDVILAAVPVCAPYSTIMSFKYKIKLIPGSLKKGKASKEAQVVFLRHPDMSTAERDAIKAIPESELIQTMLGKVKLMAPGMERNAKKRSGRKKR